MFCLTGSLPVYTYIVFSLVLEEAAAAVGSSS
jgi:hypothetical protein